MKPTPFLTAAFAASALLFTACDKDKETASGAKTSGSSSSTGAAVSEKDALDAFRKASLEINALIKEGKATDNPAVGLPKMEAAVVKMQAINTEGLPADLKESFIEARTANAEMVGLLKGMPTEENALKEFMGKVMADPKFQELQTTGKVKIDKFKEIAKKYDVEVED
jgi:hypothetical protein